MLSTMSSVTNAMTPRIPDKNAECAAFAARYPRRDPRVFVAVAIAPYHVVKMRRHSFALRF